MAPNKQLQNEGVVGLLIFGLLPKFPRGQRQKWEVAPMLRIARKFCIFYAVTFFLRGNTVHSKSGNGNHFASTLPVIWYFVDYVLRSPSDEPLQCSKATAAYGDAVQILWFLTFCSQTESVRMGTWDSGSEKEEAEGGRSGDSTVMTDQIG